MNVMGIRSPFHSDGSQFAWDSTSLTLAETCLTKYNLQMLQNWRPEVDSVHLTFGGIFASACEHYHKLRFSGSDHEGALCTIVKNALVASWGRPMDHPAKTRPNLIRTIIWYLDEFGDETKSSFKTWRLANGKPAVELSFSIEIAPGILLCGHLDRVIEFQGDLFVADNKTTGRTITSAFFGSFDMDIQMSMYALAGQMVLKSPIKGVMIDGAQIAVGFSRFVRGFTYRTPARLQEHLTQTLDTIAKACTATRLGHFPMNRTACNHYRSDDGLMQGCPFRTVCTADPSLRDNFLRGGFKKQIWNPLEPR